MPARAALAFFFISTLVGAYGLGSLRGSGLPSDTELKSIESFRASLKSPDLLHRTHRFNRFVWGLGPDNVELAADIVEDRRLWLADDELRNFMIAWTRFDAAAAWAWAASRRGKFGVQASGAAMYSWAFHDPGSARAALESLTPSASPRVREAFVAGWLRSGSYDGVFDYIARETNEAVRQRYTNLLAVELIRAGPEAVVRWAESIPEADFDDYKRVAFHHAGNIIAREDPLSAARWIEGHLEREYSARTPGVIATRWLELDPPAAMDWLSNLPTGTFRDDAIRSNFQRWRGTNSKGAEQWLRASAPSDGLDVAVALMIREATGDPEAALGWANQIYDRTGRSRTVLLLGRRWMRKDRDAALQWLETSELQEKMKQLILNPPVVERNTPTDARPVPEPGPHP